MLFESDYDNLTTDSEDICNMESEHSSDSGDIDEEENENDFKGKLKE